MSDQPGGLPYLNRYLAVLTASVVGITLIGYLLAVAAGIALPMGALAVLPPMIGALHVGQHWGRERGHVPEARAAWRWAGAGALVYLALIVVLAVPMFGVIRNVLGLAVVLAVLTTLMTVLLNRFFLSIGARSAVAGRG